MDNLILDFFALGFILTVTALPWIFAKLATRKG